MAYIGTATSRVDGRARSPAQRNTPPSSRRRASPMASVVTSTIAKGRITRIDTSERACRPRRDRRAHPCESPAHGERRQRLQG